MTVLITVLIMLTCVVLGFFILIQNPKGGGLSGSFGSMSSQVMGVKQSTDVMEKGTWWAVGIVAFLCIASVATLTKTPGMDSRSKAPSSSSAPAKKGK